MMVQKGYKILYVKKGKKFYSFNCPYCDKHMKRQFIGAVFVCGKTGDDKYFIVRPKKV